VAYRGEGFACGALIVYHMECSFVIVCWKQLDLHKWVREWFIRGRSAIVWSISIISSSWFHIPKGSLEDQDHKILSFFKSSSNLCSLNVWVQKCTFVHVLNNVCNIPLSQLPYPCIKGDMVFMHSSKEVCLAGLKDSKSHLHEYILLTKMDKSLTHLDLCEKLDVPWKHLG